MTEDRRAEEEPIPEGFADADQRGDSLRVDLDRLERQAEELYLHKFLEHVKRVRGQHGRYLTLRAGDEIAIQAAGDGSAEILKEAIAEPDQGEDP